MKFISKLTGAVVGGFYATSAMAIRIPCGTDPSGFCEVPEPGSLWLVGLGLGIAVLVARFIKK